MHEDTKYAIVINMYTHVGRICITITLDANYDFVYYLDSALCRIARLHYILHVRMNILMLRGYLLIWLELTST